MRRYRVVVGGKVIGERKSPRTYTHAVVGTPIRRWEWEGDGRWVPVPPEEHVLTVLTWCGRESLAHKAAAGRMIGCRLRESLAGIAVVPVEFTEVKPRVIEAPKLMPFNYGNGR